MTEYEASRTLVKSPPELWAELSDQVSLAGHLAEPFGEIRITWLEPETAVAWEGERASGTVRIEPSAWGTRVTLTARAAVQPDPTMPAEEFERPPPEPVPIPAPTPAPEPLPPAARSPRVDDPPSAAEPPRRGLRRLLRGWRSSKSQPSEPPPAADELPAAATPTAASPAAATPAETEPAPASPAETEPAPTSAADPEVVLAAVLDRLGSAHHRPFSRS